MRVIQWGRYVRTALRVTPLTSWLVLVLLAPLHTYGAAPPTFKTMVSGTIIPIIDGVIGLIMVLAVLYFVIGIAKFMYIAGDDKSREYGKNMIVWGTVAMFVLVSVWGIVRIIKITFFGP